MQNQQTQERHMKMDLEGKGFQVSLLSIEVGSMEFINKRNKLAITQILKDFGLKVNTKQQFIDMSKISRFCSFTIFQAQAQPSWQDPPFLKP